MLRAMRQAQMSPPRLEDHRTHFRVVFGNDTMLDDGTVEWLNQFAALDLRENQQLALAYARHQKDISNSIYCRLTGANSRETTSDLQDLVAKGIFRQLGVRRWTSYRLSSKVTGEFTDKEETPERHQPAVDRQQRIYRLITERGQLSALAMSKELSIPRDTVTYDLRRLMAAGKIERTTTDPRDKRTMYRVAGKNT